MKYFLATLSGFILTLSTFAGGFITATMLLSAEQVPVRSPYKDVSVVWAGEPERVQAAEQETTHQPAQSSSVSSGSQGQDEEDVLNVSDGGNPIDTTTTSAVPDEAASQPEQSIDPSLTAAHLEWCSERYRSYRPETNTYAPYSGGQRECTSPFSDALSGPGSSIEAEGDFGNASNSEDGYSVGHAVEDAASGSYLSPEHIKSCMARYRSYRPEDNTYQPYGGGPRRQCE